MENWTGSLIKRKNESLTTNKLNYVCQEVECTQQAKGGALNSRNPWEGLLLGLALSSCLVSVTGLTCPPRGGCWHVWGAGRGSCIDPKHHHTSYSDTCILRQSCWGWLHILPAAVKPPGKDKSGAPSAVWCDRSQQWETSCNSMLSTLGVNLPPCFLLIRPSGTSWLKVSSQRGHKCPVLQLTPFLRSFSPWKEPFHPQDPG